MRVDSFHHLFVDHLRELFSAKQQVIQILPKMISAVSSFELKEVFRNHLKEAKKQLLRLKQIFKELNEDPSGETSDAMEGLIKEVEEILKKRGQSAVKDAALIGAAQSIEHYEIAAYGTLRTYAKLLNFEKAEELFEVSIEEEGKTDKELTILAEGTEKTMGINQEAFYATSYK